MGTYNDSKFNMWRACIAAIWLDGELSPEEKSWMEEKIKNLDFTDTQRSTLTNDLVKSVDFLDVIDKVTDKKDRAFLVHQIRVIGHLDGAFSSEEKIKMEVLREFVLKSVDLVELERQIAEDEKASYHEDEVYKVHNKNSWIEKMIRYSQRAANPGDYKFPDKE